MQPPCLRCSSVPCRTAKHSGAARPRCCQLLAPDSSSLAKIENHQKSPRNCKALRLASELPGSLMQRCSGTNLACYDISLCFSNCFSKRLLGQLNASARPGATGFTGAIRFSRGIIDDRGSWIRGVHGSQAIRRIDGRVWVVPNSSKTTIAQRFERIKAYSLFP